MDFVFYFFICIAATILGAIAGIGGGVIIKPVLDALGGLSVSSIGFLSGCTVLAMSIVSLLRSRGGEVKIDPRKGTLLAAGGAVGGVAGKYIFDTVKSGFGSDGLVGSVQSVLMIVLTLGVLVYVLKKDRIRSYRVENPVACCLVGLILGILSSFLGIGGGPINLAVLYFCFSMDTKTAALNSIYVILFSQIASLASTIALGKVPDFSPLVLVSMVAGGVLGGFIGRAFSKRMSNRQVDLLFRWTLMLITGISSYNLYRYFMML